MAERHEEFFVGYQPKAPPEIATRSRLAVSVILIVGLTLGLAFAMGQDRFDVGVFEFGVDQEFTGLLVERPYPLLMVSGAGHLLVAYGKHGADELVSGLDGQRVRVTGSRIYNNRAQMLEVRSVERLSQLGTEPTSVPGRPLRRSLGTHTLKGEIVDSKCHLGVMKPGRGKTHKACAIRCISGGVPPLLRVEDRSGRVDYFLLVSTSGQRVNHEVLDLVAMPVEITGEVVRFGNLWLLYADPAKYRRLGS